MHENSNVARDVQLASLHSFVLAPSELAPLVIYSLRDQVLRHPRPIRILQSRVFAPMPTTAHVAEYGQNALVAWSWDDAVAWLSLSASQARGACPALRVTPATACAHAHHTWNTSLYWRPWSSGHPWCLSCMSHGWIHAIASRVLESLRCIFVRYSLPTGNFTLDSMLRAAGVRHDRRLKDGRMADHLANLETLRVTLPANGRSPRQAVLSWICARSPGPSRASVSRPSSRSKRTSRRCASCYLPTARCSWSRRRSRTSR